MRVIISGSSGGLQNNNVSDIEFATVAGLDNIFETGITYSHKSAEQFRITKKPCSQELRHGQHNMPISYTWYQPSADKICPSVGISFCTGKAKTGFAGESNASSFSATATSIPNEAHFVGITTIEHFLNIVVVVGIVKASIDLIERIPVVVKNLFECIFINAFHGCSLRTTITKLVR